MTFKGVYNALFDVVSENATLLTYMSTDDFRKGFKETLPARKYMVIFEPGTETEPEKTDDYDKSGEFDYEVQLYCRTVLTHPNVSSAIVGSSSSIGVLDFTDQVKEAVRSIPDLGYNAKGSSISNSAASDNFDLTSSAKYITVCINGRRPLGYDAILCGSTTLAGDAIASNIQASLRALGKFANDGFREAICTYDSTLHRFTIQSDMYGVKSTVAVSAGATDDCSSILGFDSPTEERGRKITKVKFKPVTSDNRAFPVRYRIIPVAITEERLKGGS